MDAARWCCVLGVVKGVVEIWSVVDELRQFVLLNRIEVKVHGLLRRGPGPTRTANESFEVC